jgi:hypothetical protein
LLVSARTFVRVPSLMAHGKPRAESKNPTSCWSGEGSRRIDRGVTAPVSLRTTTASSIFVVLTKMPSNPGLTFTDGLYIWQLAHDYLTKLHYRGRILSTAHPRHNIVIDVQWRFDFLGIWREVRSTMSAPCPPSFEPIGIFCSVLGLVAVSGTGLCW